ncbi:hypothetical protein [Mumia quercus]|uniref:hypothetical protein n=1 Tax=Mumia quercus TaxID=2976125 RepID=UPI0021D1EF9E|nr:hypothetical protein [Mumia quercus]
MRRVRALGALVVAVLAVVAAVLAVGAAEIDPAKATTAGEPGDRARTIIETFEAGEHVYVGPEMASLLTAEQIAQVEEAAASSDPHVFVALVGSHLEAGYDGTHHLLAQLAEGVDAEGVFLAWDGDPRTGYSRPSEGLRGYLSPEMAGKEDQALLRFIDRADNEVERIDPSDPDQQPFDYWGGVGGGVTAGLLMVLVGYPALMLVLGIFRALAGAPFLPPGRWRDFFVGRTT